MTSHEDGCSCDDCRKSKFTYGNTMCAWCNKVIKEGNPALLVSHGICESCSTYGNFIYLDEILHEG